jgi:hypothetical protein
MYTHQRRFTGLIPEKRRFCVWLNMGGFGVLYTVPGIPPYLHFISQGHLTDACCGDVTSFGKDPLIKT